jgi:hypothetical protein
MNRLIFVISGVLLISGCENAAIPAESGVSLCTLSIIDSVGVELGDSAYIFGAILGAEFMPFGGFAVLDRAAGNIRLYSDTGSHQRTISRGGSGPGEIVQAYGLIVWPNGDMGVFDPYQGGLMRFNPGGEYLGLQFEAVQNIPLDPVMVGDSSYVAMRSAIHHENDQVFVESFLGSFPMTWEPSVKYISDLTLFDPSGLGDFLISTFFYRPWTVDRRRGTVYVAPYDQGRYSIMVFNPDGSSGGVLTLPTVPVEKTPDEIAGEREYIAAFLTAAEGGDPMYNVWCDPLPFKHPVGSMTVDDAGNLWVLRGDRDDVFFNVWNASGEHAFDCVLPGVPGGDIRFRVSGNRMLLYRENPLDYQKIYIIAVPW